MAVGLDGLTRGAVRGDCRKMKSTTMQDDEGRFEITQFEAERPTHAVLFMVGGGGDPARHRPLLESLARQGFSLVAPHFERMVSPMPTAEMFARRARRGRLALANIARDLPVVGLGHSIGATTLLALAGAVPWLGPHEALSLPREERLSKLSLLAPATGFFAPNEALDAVGVPIQVWAGALDTLTPPSQAAMMKDRLGERVDLRIIEGAGHFSFMDSPPPHIIDSMPDREGFLQGLAEKVGAYLGHD